MKKKTSAQKNPLILRWLGPFIENNRIDCAKAHNAASLLNRSPKRIGEQLDLIECKIIHCQVGLFGSSAKEKELDLDFIIPEDLRKRLLERQHEDRIPCIACWQLSEEFGIERLDIGSACEQMGIRIKPCQLGVF